MFIQSFLFHIGLGCRKKCHSFICQIRHYSFIIWRLQNQNLIGFQSITHIIIQMRKKGKRFSFLPEVNNRSMGLVQSYDKQPDKYQHINPSPFNMQFTKNSTQSIANNFLQTKPSRFNTQTGAAKPIVLRNLPSLTKDIRTIKQQIRKMKALKQDNTMHKISRIVTEMQVRNRYGSLCSSPANQQQIYYPMPLPYYLPIPLPPSANNNYSNNTHPYHPVHSSHKEFFIDTKKNLRRWKKVANCILFVLYLKRFCRLIQKNRMQNFKLSLNKIKTNLILMRNSITKSIGDFFNILYQKKQVSFDFREATTSKILKQKLTSIRKLIKLLIEDVFEGLKLFSKSVELTEAIYHLCRHGNYSCTEPLLTKEEMDLSCISPSFYYISADSTLEKVNLINLIFIKLLIYSTLLSPEKINSNLTEDEIPNNLFVLSSILYEFIIFIQDEYMSALNPVYEIGNYRKHKKVRYLQALKYKTEVQTQGELICGLIGQKTVLRHFRFQLWAEETSLVKQILNTLHKLMSNYHQNYSKRFF